jgi:hypothetical protein
MTSIYEKDELTSHDIHEEVLKRAEKYNNKSFMETFALYLGTAQILEFALKKLLESLFNIPLEETERSTLGQTRARLEQCGLRNDYTELLKIVVKERNHAAHELLANQAILNSFDVPFSEHMQFKELNKSIYNLERAVFLFDYTQHNQAWLIKD